MDFPLDINKLPEMQSEDNHLVPDHEKGKKNDLKHTVKTASYDVAEDLFVLGKERLLSVNDWHSMSGVLSAHFRLTDTKGHEINRKAHKGDYIKIKLPATPGTSTGEGFDWVRIEAIQYDDYPDENGEIISMRLRPASSPTNNADEVAHFFENEATSTFSIERHGKLIIAHYHGRNEVPNTETNNFPDKARNTVIATGAMLGLSELQWKNLIKGFIEPGD